MLHYPGQDNMGNMLTLILINQDQSQITLIWGKFLLQKESTCSEFRYHVFLYSTEAWISIYFYTKADTAATGAL